MFRIGMAAVSAALLSFCVANLALAESNQGGSYSGSGVKKSVAVGYACDGLKTGCDSNCSAQGQANSFSVAVRAGDCQKQCDSAFAACEKSIPQ